MLIIYYSIMERIEHIINDQSSIQIAYSVDEDNGISMEIVFEFVKTGILYQDSWTPSTIKYVHQLFTVDAELSIDAIRNEPSEVRYNEHNAICTFDIVLGERVRSIEFILPRVKGEQRNTDYIVRVMTGRAVAALKKAHSRLARVPLNLISQVNESGIPISYMRISKRFPHLDLAEIIAFEKKVLDNGGSIETHGGRWMYVDRTCNECDSLGKDWKPYMLSWTCCGPYRHSVPNQEYGHELKCMITNDASGPSFPRPNGVGAIGYDAGDQFINRAPESKCPRAVTFYLEEQDEQNINIAETKVKDARVNIQKNIGVYGATVNTLTAQITRLTEIEAALGMLDISDIEY
jgi:hypothetical protein